jgi:hypothetical protein
MGISVLKLIESWTVGDPFFFPKIFNLQIIEDSQEVAKRKKNSIESYVSSLQLSIVTSYTGIVQ